MGSLVRQELNPNSLLYKKIGSTVNEWKLVLEDVIFGLLSKRLEEGYCRGETGFILDGIPRTTIQAEILDQIVDIDLVLNLKKTEKLGIYTEQMKGVEEYYKQQKKLVNFQVAGGEEQKERNGKLDTDSLSPEILKILASPPSTCMQRDFSQSHYAILERYFLPETAKLQVTGR
ncbi:hypothetical protein C2S52_005371 [Perilla frutescens var. hirtella]|nr:hypothetical protein C2S51_010299 [Perilla frutescens var. frutescens]KAH6794894.1 hypothetical protein C2S52_005371 [Perilla frutescens var. hirtella]